MSRERLIEQIRNAPEDHPLSLIEWIPVEERLPESGRPEEGWRAVWAIADGYLPVTLWRNMRLGWRWFSTGHPFSAAVIYWAEIPEVRDG